MAVRSKGKRGRRKTTQEPGHRLIIRYLPVWVLAGLILIILLPSLLTFTVQAGAQLISYVPGLVSGAARAVGDVAGDAADQVSTWFDSEPSNEIAPLFTEQVDYWEDDLAHWAEKHELDPNLLATVMQIESCGHPDVSSVAGAQGLFQVMPFHFSEGEDQTDPDTNARRGAKVLKDCLSAADDDIGLAVACYNGGPSVINSSLFDWHDESRRYYYWATGIYADARAGSANSARLDEWLDAGGEHLCRSAQTVLERR